ncbi:MAG: hypothetical protein OXP07_15880, partial [Defluviicoccus sp.]|nr:hypothetical protein [Defluviicoccus sp.]
MGPGRLLGLFFLPEIGRSLGEVRASARRIGRLARALKPAGEHPDSGSLPFPAGRVGMGLAAAVAAGGAVLVGYGIAGFAGAGAQGIDPGLFAAEDTGTRQILSFLTDLSAGSAPVLGDMLFAFNAGVMMLAVILLLWHVGAAVVETGREGRLNFGTWEVIRILVALVLMAPIAGGASAAQYAIFGLARLGGDFANLVWTPLADKTLGHPVARGDPRRCTLPRRGPPLRVRQRRPVGQDHEVVRRRAVQGDPVRVAVVRHDRVRKRQRARRAARRAARQQGRRPVLFADLQAHQQRRARRRRVPGHVRRPRHLHADLRTPPIGLRRAVRVRVDRRRGHDRYRRDPRRGAPGLVRDGPVREAVGFLPGAVAELVAARGLRVADRHGVVRGDRRRELERHRRAADGDRFGGRSARCCSRCACIRTPRAAWARFADSRSRAFTPSSLPVGLPDPPLLSSSTGQGTACAGLRAGVRATGRNSGAKRARSAAGPSATRSSLKSLAAGTITVAATPARAQRRARRSAASAPSSSLSRAITNRAMPGGGANAPRLPAESAA